MTLPRGFVVRLAADTVLVDEGALLGGSPTRYIRLSRAARQAFNGRQVRVSNDVSAQLAEKLLDLGMVNPVVDHLPAHPERITIVIPVKDRAGQLNRLLDSVDAAAAGLGPAPRVIVVDDGSARPSDIARVAQAHHAEVLRLPTNRGPAAARNAGLALVDTELAVFLDSDLVINDVTIPTMLRHFADPKVAMVVPRITALNPEAGWISEYEETHSALDLGPRPAAVKPRSHTSWASSAALAARTLALGDGFDETMRVGEDVDLVWRLNEVGWRVRYEPEAQAQHDHRAEFSSWFTRRVEYGTSAAPLAKRHPENIPPAILAPWSAAFLVAVVAQRLWSVPVILGIGIVKLFTNEQKLRSAPNPWALSARLLARGMGVALRQGSALLLRHWWPLSLAACLFSRRMRRAVIIAAIVDTLLEYRRTRSRLDPLRFGILRRLDDIAYGAGLWYSAIKARSVSALLPEID